MNDTLKAISTYGASGSSTRVRLLDWIRWCRVDAEIFGYLDTADNSPRQLITKPFSVLKAESRLRSFVQRPGGRLLIGRSVSPFSNGELEQKLLHAWEYGVYDFDDALFATPDTAMSRIWSKRKVWERSVRAADCVIAGSDYLADAAQRLSKNVVMIPSCVDPGEYEVKRDFVIRRSYPLAVWLGSPATEQYVLDIAPALLELHARTGLRLRMISGGRAPLAALQPMVDRVQWSRETFGGQLADADFGIMPLPDSAYSRGKCAYKLLQYGAAGLPVIGSPVGANVLAIDRLDGLAASSQSEWIDQIEMLLGTSSSAREMRGANARRAVEAEYSFAAWASEWRKAVML